MGPGQVYLSRAPNDDLENFSGIDADWFKIAYFGPINDTNWSLMWQTGVRPPVTTRLQQHWH
jgi:hypothetical protein